MICELTKKDLWALIKGGCYPLSNDQIRQLEKLNLGYWGRDWYWNNNPPQDITEEELWELYKEMRER